MDARLSKRLAELARENGDRPHVSFHEATYPDTVAVRSPYEGVLLELKDSADDAGLYIYYDVGENAVYPSDDSGSETYYFEMVVCTHDNHPNYA